MRAKVDATPGEFRVSYWGVARPARNECCLAGLEEGARLCVRGCISDFATLVRKSYSDSLRLVSTLVLLERISYSANGLGTLEIPPIIPSLQAGNIPRRHADDNDDRRSTT